ncbi:GNAT family N-acetyltransferase [bacterium]|nr:GNAT family N-acetyltransferase [bacterium]
MSFTIRKIQKEDAQSIIEIDAMQSGEEKPAYWNERFKYFFESSNALGYVAIENEKIVAYVLAEARALEFGSQLCGWVFAIAVNPNFARQGIALALCRQVCLKFKELKINTIRTLVRKDEVSVLSFFRASGFKAGPFIELELELLD